MLRYRKSGKVTLAWTVHSWGSQNAINIIPRHNEPNYLAPWGSSFHYASLVLVDRWETGGVRTLLTTLATLLQPTMVSETNTFQGNGTRRPIWEIKGKRHSIQDDLMLLSKYVKQLRLSRSAWMESLFYKRTILLFWLTGGTGLNLQKTTYILQL